MTVLNFYRKKQCHEKISMITCYDYTSARILSETAVDCFLVGDSCAMTMHGFKDTLSATLPMICFHTKAVANGARDKFIVADMPFLSYRKHLSKNVSAVEALIQAGAHAIKLENAGGNIQLIRHLTESGIPVMGHLGLTGQSIHALGGFKVQGKTEESCKQLKEDAYALQEAGCFSLVLECIPKFLAKEITESLAIPTIGIGAGPYTDGQVLVYQDLLGFNTDFKPKFVKKFMDGAGLIKQSVEDYVKAIHSGDFPHHENCYGD
jgi:3-methyl-2-oxobutanoate hydroxymethyltransferase